MDPSDDPDNSLSNAPLNALPDTLSNAPSDNSSDHWSFEEISLEKCSDENSIICLEPIEIEETGESKKLAEKLIEETHWFGNFWTQKNWWFFRTGKISVNLKLNLREDYSTSMTISLADICWNNLQYQGKLKVQDSNWKFISGPNFKMDFILDSIDDSKKIIKGRYSQDDDYGKFELYENGLNSKNNSCTIL